MDVLDAVKNRLEVRDYSSRKVDGKIKRTVLDAVRALTHMQLVASEQGVGSCIYTAYDEEGMRGFLHVPDDYATPAVVGFGVPVEESRGGTNRKPLTEVAFRGRFGVPCE